MLQRIITIEGPQGPKELKTDSAAKAYLQEIEGVTKITVAYRDGSGKNVVTKSGSPNGNPSAALERLKEKAKLERAQVIRADSAKLQR